MDISRMARLLSATTTPFRKGEAATETEAGGLTVRTFYGMPHEAEADAALEMVDLVFITVGVDMAAAEAHRDELVAMLACYPELGRLAQGPSYIEVGAVLGDQGAALHLFALGKALGLWSVITPATLGFDGYEVMRMAGQGYVMMSGWRPGAAIHTNHDGGPLQREHEHGG